MTVQLPLQADCSLKTGGSFLHERPRSPKAVATLLVPPSFVCFTGTVATLASFLDDTDRLVASSDARRGVFLRLGFELA